MIMPIRQSHLNISYLNKINKLNAHVEYYQAQSICRKMTRYMFIANVEQKFYNSLVNKALYLMYLLTISIPRH